MRSPISIVWNAATLIIVLSAIPANRYMLRSNESFCVKLKGIIGNNIMRKPSIISMVLKFGNIRLAATI